MSPEPTDPYTPPKAPSDGSPESNLHHGHRCPACNSRNTGQGVLSHKQADLFFLLFFGWLYLFKIAFSRRTDTCRDCGETFRYKTIGSWISVGLLILIILITIDYLWFYSQRT